MKQRVGAIILGEVSPKYRERQLKNWQGFTIVELLIVIVVIAILAAVTIVAYNGIQQRAKDSSVQADVVNAVKKLETVKAQDSAEQYPAALASAGIVASGTNTYYYQYSSTDNSYCLQSSNGSIQYYASSMQQAVTQGTCGSDSLIGWWPFNNSPNDQSSNGLNGTLSSAGVTSANGQNGQANGAYAFSGTASFIDFGNSTKFNQPELTMSAWVNTNYTNITAQTIMAKESKYKYRLAAGGMSMVQALVSSSTGWTNIPSCSYTYATGTWYHVVTTISTQSGRIKIYVNGAQICDQPGPTAMTSYNTNNLFVGSYNNGGAEGFNGRIDDARFYSRALTAAEIKGLYDRGAQ